MDINKLNEIFNVYEKYGGKDYIGENVSQLEHALQCAQLAEKDNFQHDVILGALFHDIGSKSTNITNLICTLI